jgi:protein required for attachment to host cells
MGYRQEEQHRESQQPKPRRERGHNAPAIQEPDRHQIEQIKQKAGVGQALKHQIASGQIEDFAYQRSG